MFKAEKFNADKWARLFKKSGAKFVMPVCEHHDGFVMYDTVFNRWNAKAMGPLPRCYERNKMRVKIMA